MLPETETEYQKAIRWILKGIAEDDATWILDGFTKLQQITPSEPVTEKDRYIAKKLLANFIILKTDGQL